MNQDANPINMANGGDVGAYIIRIAPDLNMDTVTLQFNVKTYYCAGRDALRSRFFHKFPRDAYKRHSYRLVTSDQTLEELNEELNWKQNYHERRGGEFSIVL